ncbi:unnamed protein product [Adineta steineri]|uniref:NHL repeat containing protein n=1 Tax=Adineta steineri TaxID=433720 RepID=A0A814XCW8_9BILA|nr:unnamed protein product [Adineta steineri]CAF1500537.1 unnamed protein product [Adineta steineri]
MQKSYFICQQWFAEEKNDGRISIGITVEILSFVPSLFIYFSIKLNKKKRSRLMFSWWCLFFAYSLSFISVLISSFFITIRGIQSAEYLDDNDDFVLNHNEEYIHSREFSFTYHSRICNNRLNEGTSGSQTTQLNSPMSLAMGGNYLYIADYGNNRIIRYDTTTKTPDVYIAYDTTPLRNTYVHAPISIRYHAPITSLVIAQQLGYNVVRWTLGGKNWNLICGSVSSELNGTSRTLFNRICSVDVDSQTNTYVDTQ